MHARLYRDDPLSPRERGELEDDLIAFSDRELDLLGDIRGRDVLYAGGKSPLWIEGLAVRIGPSGSLTVLDRDKNGLALAEESFAPEDLPLRPRFVCGDVFEPPFERASFDLAYSSGLLHELDVRSRKDGILDLFGELERVVVAGGEIAGSDFVDTVPAAQVEDEAIEAEVRRLSTGEEPFGIGSPERIFEVLDDAFVVFGYEVLAPFEIRHLDKLTLAREMPPDTEALEGGDREKVLLRWKAFLRRVRDEGYTRPATLFFCAKS